MGAFLEHAIERAGLGPILAARRAGDVAPARALLDGRELDLLLLGAIADVLRAEEVGETVRIHGAADPAVTWIDGQDLALLRAVARARILGARGARIGVDWGAVGLELAQVALGFGASELAGPITRKSGLVILADEKQRVKGRGLVASSALKRREIARLVENAGRVPEMVERALPAQQETAHA